MAGVPILDLFAGAGGLSLGLEASGFRIVAAVEHNSDAAKTYHSAHPDTDLFDDDIEVLLRRKALRRFQGHVQVMVGGPPCQPWSQGGHRQGEDDPRNALPDFVEAIRQVAPAAFVLENSSGLGRGVSRAYLVALVAELESLGFRVTHAVLNAAEYGVPQKRLRLFLVGLRDRTFRFPKGRYGPGRRNPWPTAGDHVGVDTCGEPNPSPVTYAKNPQIRPGPYDGLLWNGGGRPIDLARPAPTILASGGNKVPWVDTQGLVPGYHAHLRAGGEPRVGNVPGARRITVAEAASLQTFPAQTAFMGGRSSQFRQIGNAVPPVLAKALGRALCSYLTSQEPARIENPRR
ncbi:MAG: DNA cytosine methyltransferase [Actinobacteria bacterium]|nr:DNA cytosine methyltransferase [Actinomycetota bacterium]